MPQSGFTPIITYNTATASAAPSAGNLTQGELAVNVTDKKIYTKNSGGSVVQVGSGPDATETLTNKTLTSPDINGGTIDGTAIGSTTPAAGSFTTLSASGYTAASGYYINASSVLTPGTTTQGTQFVTSSILQWACGSGGYSWNNNANSASLMSMTNAGAVTIPGNLSLTGGTLGYGTGAGGTVTQATSKSTAVTLNKPSGQITMNNAALAAGDVALFQVTNSVAVASSIVLVSPNANPAGEFYSVWSSHTFAGGFFVCVKNITAGSRSEALVINFAVLSGATS